MPYPYRTFREWVDEEERLGNVLRINAPIKCGDYGHIVEIGNEIPGKIPETEIRATVRYLHTLPGKPIGIIENPVNNRPDIPVVVNPWPSRQRTLRGLGLKTKEEFCQKLAAIKENRVKTLEVPKSKAPCKDVILSEKEIDLTKDIPRCWVEFNQVLWSTCNGTIIVYDPDKGTHDLGKCRLGQYEWKDADPAKPFPEAKVKKEMFATLIYSGPQHSQAGEYYIKFLKNNKPMPAAFAFGLPTDFHIVAAVRSFRWPEGGDEYELVGGLRGAPVEVTESETIPGLKVPAHAEWVIEGEILPEDEIMPPYAEDIASGYLFGGERCPVFKVKCITHQKNPWWDATTFSSSGSSVVLGEEASGSHEGPHTGLQFLMCEAPAITFLRSIGFKVKDVVMIGGGREVVVVQLEVDGSAKPIPHYGKQVLMALHGNPAISVGPVTKYLIVVGPDINPYDFTDVMWALGTRTQPVSDTIVIQEGLSGWGDPSGIASYLGWKTYGQQVMIDALIKVPERYPSYPPRAEPSEWEVEAIRQLRERLGKTGAVSRKTT